MRDDHGGNTTMSASAALAGAMPSDASTLQLCDYCAALVNASSSSLFIDAHQCLSLLATAGGAQFNATSLAHLLPEHCNYLQQHDAQVCSQADSCWLVKIASRIVSYRIKPCTPSAQRRVALCEFVSSTFRRSAHTFSLRAVSGGLPIRQNRQLPKARHGAGARPVQRKARKTFY